MLKSAGYSVGILTDRIESFDGQDYVEEVRNLRGNWFDQERSENLDALTSLIDRASDVLMQAGRAWFERESQELIDGDSSMEGALSLMDDLVYVPGEKYDYEVDGEFKIKITLPHSWFDHYRYYIAQDSLLAETLLIGYIGSERTNGALIEEYESFLQRKHHFCNQTFSWSVNNGMSSALKFGYLLPRVKWDASQRKNFKDKLHSVTNR
jgi:hypothetical protein